MRPRLAGLLRADHGNGFRLSKRFLSFTRPHGKSGLSVADLLYATNKTRPPQDQSIVFEGYVQAIRKQRMLAFAAIRDGSSVIPVQALIKPEDAVGLTTGTAVQLTGTWQECPPKAQQTHELHVTDIRILGENNPATDPLQNKYQSPVYLRTIPHLRARIPRNALLLRLRSQVIATLTNFFASEGFVQTHTPIITSSDCEGAGEVFTVSSDSSKVSTQQPQNGKPAIVEHFFKEPKYLTVSAQLHLEALAQGVGNVWTLSPTFRAEKSDTPRHLSEFYMLEAEMTFVNNMTFVMDVVEKMLRATANALTNSAVGKQLLHTLEYKGPDAQTHISSLTPAELKKRWQALQVNKWPRVTYQQAITKLQNAYANKAKFKVAPSYEGGLQAEHERYLADKFGNGRPVFITHYPRNQKPFYMMPSTTDGKETVECFDLLVPDLCELVGGSMREHRSEELIKRMREQGLLKDGDDQESISNLQWYIDLRQYGSVSHGGFGLGFDRLLAYLSGVTNIRDVVAFPRWHGRCNA